MTSATLAAHVADQTEQARRDVRSTAPAWSAVAAWGAGLVELALGAGALTGEGGAVRGVGAVMVALGLCGLAWGAATLARGRLIAPRASVVGALAGLAATIGQFVLAPAHTSVFAVAALLVLLLPVALACARQTRRGMDAAPPRIAVLLVAAVVVAGIVTPALGATEAGRLAPDHGSHQFVDPGHHG